MIKKFKEMNIFEKLIALLLGADQVIYESSKFSTSVRFGLALSVDTDKDRDGNEISGHISYPCPQCKETFIHTFIRINEKGEDIWENCNNVEINPYLPCICYKCFNKIGGDWEAWMGDEDEDNDCSASEDHGDYYYDGDYDGDYDEDDEDDSIIYNDKNDWVNEEDEEN